jgi:hypothetical protein
MARYRRRTLWAFNFAAFFVFAIALSNLRYDVPPYVTMLGWTWLAGVLMHGVYLIFQEGGERAVRRELERERAAYSRAVAESLLMERGFEKPKRSDRLTVDDDGELVDYPDEDERWDTRKRG